MTETRAAYRANPLAENCRQNRVEGAGKVVGVELDFFSLPQTQYRMVSARLRDEYAAQGRTVARVSVRDRQGRLVHEQVGLGYPYSGEFVFEHVIFPGSDQVPVEHVIANAYAPPDKGPLGIAVYREGKLISDVAAGLGLPYGHHVSFEIEFQERGEGTAPPDGVDDTDTAPPGGDVAARLARMEEKLDRLLSGRLVWG